MALSEKCDTTSNYIGQIEMGRRIPSFDKIEKIAKALKISSNELFVWEAGEKQKAKKPGTKEYLQEMPPNVRKELVSSLLSTLKKGMGASFNPQNYK